MDRLSALLAHPGFFAIACSAHADEASETFFETKIRPVLATDCLPCHGGKKTESGLKVDSRESLLRGGDRGPAIVAGEPEKSLLVRAIRYTDDELKMPPKRHLPAEVAAAFAQWVAQGAVWPAPEVKKPAGQGARQPRHWAFQRIKAVVPPPDPTGQSSRPIDRFIAARRRAAGLRPVRAGGPADLDPPRHVRPDRFAADARGSRRFRARRFARRLFPRRRPLARLAALRRTMGPALDGRRPLCRHRRRQRRLSRSRRPRAIATTSSTRSTATSRSTSSSASSSPATSWPARVRPTIMPSRWSPPAFWPCRADTRRRPFELWHLTLEDTIETTGRAFLGLTLRCARCHDHKFDPVSQRDYYALYGIFASTTFPYAGSEELQSKKFPRLNFVPLVEPARAEPKLKAYQDRLREARRRRSRRSSRRKTRRRRRHLKELRTELTRAQAAVAAAGCAGGATPSPRGSRSMSRSSGGAIPPVRAKSCRAACRGSPSWTASRRLPVPSHGSGRLELAHWLTQPDNPLTPRVMVNRIWQHHFGRGIVATPSNFGLRGEPPTHPELLDWLAARFVASGWSIKAIHREILLSQTYQLASDLDAHDAAIDPDDRWLWRFPRQRLDAESIRDAMLAVAGNLDRNPPGPAPVPADRDMALDPARRIQGGLSVQPPRRLPDDPAAGETPLPGDLRRPRHQRLDRGPPALDGPAPGSLPHEQPVRPGTGRRLRAPLDRRLRPIPAQRIELAYELAWSRPPTCR